MSASIESNLSFGGVAPSGGARLSTQEVWQSISDMAGQVRALATLHTSLHTALSAALASSEAILPRAHDSRRINLRSYLFYQGHGMKKIQNAK